MRFEHVALLSFWSSLKLFLLKKKGKKEIDGLRSDEPICQSVANGKLPRFSETNGEIAALDGIASRNNQIQPSLKIRNDKFNTTLEIQFNSFRN